MSTSPPDPTQESSNGSTSPDPEPGADATVEGQPDRLSQPRGLDESPPRLPFTVVGVGASAGGLEAYGEFLDACKPDANVAYVLIQHLSPRHTSMMAELLQKHTAMPVAQVEDSMKIEPNHVYVIRPGYTMTIHEGRLHLGESASQPMNRRPVDDFFKSLAEEQRERAIVVILSGTGSNGTLGCESVKAVGGICIAQDPDSAKFPSMPRSLIDSNLADAILRPGEMFATIQRYASHPYAAGRGSPPEVVAQRERLALGEVIAVLRARTRHDFSVYKKPTLVRRIQRRMSLMQMESMEDYARTLRQTHSEVVALCDDLMIHVTGFFRDPEVWEALRDRVIRPMVAEKPDNATVRCWVTACSSGEEAYTIGILLLEAAEAVGKRFDVKIFATDTAERSLGQARAGVFPGGIEGEISPERLARFFERDDAFYRVKKELRELVVFAPQNVLQDPPFSRLDLCTCRNLLIYIEPETQYRILAMLHFGLREGGTLLLGNSETIAGAEELFEPIDKPHRIYRRVGLTRHGTIEFPVPHVKLSKRARAQLAGGNGEGAEEQPRPLTRAGIAQLATKTLLDAHTPAAVVVDRAGQIVHVHGDTDLFLKLPPGEPTRDLMMMARDEVRGGVRSVLRRAMSGGETVHYRDGTLGEGDRRVRIQLTAGPLGWDGAGAGPLYFLVSFATHPDAQLAVPDHVDAGKADELAVELHRVRDELQSTVEELQTSNEEMKASHEEVTSINEELQSTNEELETSKEELQSLNEELSTVNAQLQAKMAELERTGNDLGSLLTSTEIAVIFLDRGFRIRRFTPATKKLMELIPSDVGRPFADLARRFEDPALSDDVRRVLETLGPAEASVAGAGGRRYERRVLPYRTAEDRIDGVVITFVDVTDRHRAEATLRASEGRLRTMADAAPVLIWQTERAGLTFVNRHYLEFFGKPFEALAGMGWAEFMHPDETAAYVDAYLAAFERQQAYEYEGRFRRHDGEYRWLQNIGTPHRAPDGTFLGFIGCSVDVTDRTRADQRQAFLLKLADALRPLADPVAIEVEATRVLGEQLGADRVLYAEVEPDEDHIVIHRDFNWAGTLSITGRQRLSNFGSHWVEGYRAGRTLATSDVRAIGGAVATAFEAIGVRACVGVPVKKAGKFVGVLIVHSATPRLWGPLDVNLIEATAERTWAEVERARAEAKLAVEQRQFGLVVENLVDYAIFLLDPRGVITGWWEGATRVTGYANEEAVGRHFRLFYPPELAAEPDRELSVATKTGRFEAEGWRIRPDGSPYWVNEIITAVHGTGGELIGFAKIARDLTDQKRSQEVLNSAKEAAESASQMKDEFLATLSHELRTPLSAILLWAKVLDRGADAEDLDAGLSAIRNAADAQRQLIDDLLDTSRITSGNLRLEVRETEIGSVVGGAVESVTPAALLKGVDVRVDVASAVGTVQVDPHRMKQVIWNLLANAIKFTPGGGFVEVKVRRVDQHVVIRVSDSGKGITAEFLPHVFELFRQADSSASRADGGLGLGLAICRNLVEQHGGVVSAESDGAGLGATFTVTLPLPRTPRVKGRPKKSPPLPAVVTAAEPLSGVSVLLVEDDALLRSTLATVLRKAGGDVSAVESAALAFEAFQGSRPDVLVSDIGMAVEDGYALLRRVRAEEEAAGSARVPAVALTAYAGEENRRKALAAGFDRHVAKPVEPAEFVSVLVAMTTRR